MWKKVQIIWMKLVLTYATNEINYNKFENTKNKRLRGHLKLEVPTFHTYRSCCPQRGPISVA
jgi:hypothetical protein